MMEILLPPTRRALQATTFRNSRIVRTFSQRPPQPRWSLPSIATAIPSTTRRRGIPRNSGIVSTQQSSSSTLRWFASSPNREEEADEASPPPAVPFADVSSGTETYASPLGGMISRLKMVSITGCVLSVGVLPGVVLLKGGDLPNFKEATVGTIATFTSVGSTAALHFFFGSYVLELKALVQQPEDDAPGEEEDGTSENTANDAHPNPPPPLVLEATTRSLFGFWKNTHVFDPRTDVTPYRGLKPFANFCASGVPLYVHPERLDPTTRAWLGFGPSGNETASRDDEHRGVHEGLPPSKKKKADDDDFF